MPALSWITSLVPVDTGSLTPASGTELLARASQRLGDGPVRWVVEVGHRMAERIIREMPVFGGGAEAFDILRMGTESSTIQFLLNLIDDIEGPVAPQEALDGVLDFVRRGIGLESVLRGTRLGHREMSESFLGACERLGDPKQRVEEMKYLTTRLFEYMDAFSAELAGQYLEDQVRWSASDTAARLELVHAVLAGADPDPAGAMRTLRYDLRGTHLALVAWSHDSHIDIDAVELQNACLDLLKRVDATRRLVIPVGAGRVWAWGELAHGGADVISTIERTRLPAGVFVAAGEPSEGVRGFRASHLEATAVERLLPSASGSDVVRYRSVDLLTLLLEDRARAVAYAAAELGALARDSPAHRDLRLTVGVFLDEQGSTQSAAQRLAIARNTVSYRVRRAEEIMGSSIRDRSLQLRAALLIADAFPRQVGDAAQA